MPQVRTNRRRQGSLDTARRLGMARSLGAVHRLGMARRLGTARRFRTATARLPFHARSLRSA